VHYTGIEDLIRAKSVPFPTPGTNIQRDLSMKTLWLTGLAALVLNAPAMAGKIETGAPVISGDVSTFVNRQEGGHTELSTERLQALSGWLEQHRSQWRGMVTPASSEPVQLQVDLRHSDGAVTSISLISGTHGGHYLRLTGPEKWAYRSFGGIFKSWAAIRFLSGKELTSLQRIVGIS
jgi:hypothetical protein